MAVTRGNRSEVPLAIRLLGAFEARLEDEPLPTLRSRKSQWLLALLTLQCGRAVDREWLAVTLWPESPESQALYNLRRNLSDLRHVLGPEARRLSSPTLHTVCLDLEGAYADITLFDEAMARGDVASLEAATRLYRGPFLAGCGEEWVLHEREIREQAYLTALETLAGNARNGGDYQAAVGYLRLALTVEPLRETAQCALMEALAAAGDLAAATQVYREFRLLLHRELSAAPSPATTALFQELRVRARSAARHEPLPAPERPSLRVRQIVESAPAPDLPASLPLPVSQLPRPLSRFVGREREREQIKSALAATRLVTLAGPGGVGKTRLALEVAGDVLAVYPDGAWFIDLGGLADPGQVRRSVAQALGVRAQPGSALPETLLSFLAPKRLLLVLDNCEHLLDACAALVETLLVNSPELRVLATSRQSLGLAGETVWQVPALSLPDPGEWSMVDGSWLTVDGTGLAHRPSTINHQPSTMNHQPSILLQFEAVRLFVERGRAVARSFALTPQNAAAVVEVCRRLDGLPLAIELAAARLKALSVEQIAEHLTDRFWQLTAGGRTSLPRHQTLHAAVQWSHALLTEPERVLLRRLAVFTGSFTLEAAEAVCSGVQVFRCSGVQADERLPQHPAPEYLNTRTPEHRERREPDVLDLLTALVDKSLVLCEAEGDEARYRLLETVRQYGWEKLQEAGEAERARERHAEWYQALAELSRPDLPGPAPARWLERLEREHENLRAAREWAAAQPQGDSVPRLE